MNEHITLQSPEGTEIVALDNIVWCKANSSYSVVSLAGKRELVQSHNLKDIEKKLGHYPGMVRVHKSWLINSDHIRSWTFEIRLVIFMNDGTRITASRRRKSALLRQLRVLTGGQLKK